MSIGGMGGHSGDMAEIPNPEQDPAPDQNTTAREAGPDEPAPPVDPTSHQTPPPPHPGQIPVRPIKRLYRDPNGAFGGVMAGLAHYFEIDVTLARLAMVVFALLAGSGILVYIVAWILVPEAPHPLYYEQPVQAPIQATPQPSTNDGVGV